MTLHWKIGVEIELLAPRGSSRRTLAEKLATAAGGVVCPFFHPQSEPSLVPGVPVFDNLTLGFAAHDATGDVIARCVDDLTLQEDLERERPSLPGWFRIVSDDMRLLLLVARTGRADGGLREALAPLAALFGTELEAFEGGMFRVCDETRSPLVLGTTLPGERERPCEIVTPPLLRDHATRLEALLAPARELGFTRARESATHIHFDAAPLCSAAVVQRLVRFLRTWGAAIKILVGTNPACRRLGDWPEALRSTVEARDFTSLSWPEAQAVLGEVGLSKFCDFNLRNFVHDIPGKPTFEVRVLPGLQETEPILQGAALFEGILRHVIESATIADESPRVFRTAEVRELLERLPLDPELRRAWLRRCDDC